MRDSYKTTICGVTASIALMLMLLTYINPFLTYTCPVFAGVLLAVIMQEVGNGWALGTYASIGLLSLFLLSDKEAAVFFVAFFGYYPMLRALLKRKIKPKFIRYILELIIFNASLIASTLISMYVFNVDYNEVGDFGKASMISTLVMMNIIFVLYDFMLSKFILAYQLTWQKKLRKIFQKK